MLATLFAEIVGLLCHYRQEKGHQEGLDHQKFIEWLEYHRHEEIKNLIVNTAALRTEIDSLLRSDHAVMIEKLNQIQDILIKLLGRTEEFKGLALAMSPDAQLSDQAVSILRQFVQSGDNTFLATSLRSKFASIQCYNRAVRIEISQPRFIADDLTQLVRLRLLTEERLSQGDATYGMTRNAVRFIEALDSRGAQ
jgi:hypothetical protein